MMFSALLFAIHTIYAFHIEKGKMININTPVSVNKMQES